VLVRTVLGAAARNCG